MTEYETLHTGRIAMKASDIMVSNVITIGVNATVHDVAQLLVEKRISAVPVVGGKGELLGIVSEGDLLRRAEVGTEKRRSWWLEAWMSKEALANDFVKSHARKATDVMTRRVVTAKPDTSLGEIATLLEQNGIKRVPIVAGGKVVGIVSRSNLIQALASATKTNGPQAKVDDATIREKVMEQLKMRPWAKPWLVNVVVQDGTVNLWGVVDSQAEKDAARVAVETTPGVRAVSDHLVTWPIVADFD
jgi:CBS domain-containing protein